MFPAQVKFSCGMMFLFLFFISLVTLFFGCSCLVVWFWVLTSAWLFLYNDHGSTHFDPRYYVFPGKKNASDYTSKVFQKVQTCGIYLPHLYTGVLITPLFMLTDNLSFKVGKKTFPYIYIGEIVFGNDFTVGLHTFSLIWKKQTIKPLFFSPFLIVIDTN